LKFQAALSRFQKQASLGNSNTTSLSPQSPMSSSKSDPRVEAKVVAFHLPKAQEANDWTGNIALYSCKLVWNLPNIFILTVLNI
jgi:hypothetical protein